MTRIAIIQGHPDPHHGHFCHALAAAYAEGAAKGGHEVRRIDVADLDFPILRSKDEWESPLPDGPLAEAQRTIVWAEHLMIVHPLWLGEMPALLKAFLEQVARGGFGVDAAGGFMRRPLRGRSARVVVTMGMPALIYRWYFGAHGLKNLRRGILGFVGVRPVRATLIGMIERPDDLAHARWLDRLEALGRRAS